MALQERKKQQAEAEFQEWKGQFSVDESGQAAHTVDQLQQRRQELCAKVKLDKV